MNEIDILNNKFKFITRWIFKDIFVNVLSTKCIWGTTNYHMCEVGEFEFEINESNIGSLQLTCSAIETYGRIMLGEGIKEGVSEKCFVAFIIKYFPKKYKSKANELYSNYRCGLLHSHVLGFNSGKGFFPTRGKDRNHWDKHLQYTNADASRVSKNKNQDCQRLILNIDDFFQDFRKAVTNYVKDTCNKTVIKGLRIQYGKKKTIGAVKNIELFNNASSCLREIPER